MPDHRHGQTEDDHISQKIGNAVSVVEFSLIDAMFRNEWVPSACDRRACEDLREHCGYHPTGHDDTDSHCDKSESPCGEDPTVHDENRDFDGRKSERIENIIDVHDLALVSTRKAVRLVVVSHV